MKDERLDRACKYCEAAGCLSDPDLMLCKHYGVVEASHRCRRFRYDPLKRAPKRALLEPELERIEI